MKTQELSCLKPIVFVIVMLLFVWGCPGTEDDLPESGTFIDSAVSGLDYNSDHESGLTSASGRFLYESGDTITFSIGNLVLGSATAASTLSPIDLVDGATDATQQAVNNICVLLQTLDQDGTPNNGIQITSAIRHIVSDYAGMINFDQTTAAFAADGNVTAMLAELNAADPAVFTDLDARDRTLKDATQAATHLTSSLSDRITVDTTYGMIKGFGINDDTWAWFGIPYAAPPVGNRRWRPPVAPASWNGVREATEYSDQAAQYSIYAAFGLGGMSEDCLYLNVLAPRNADDLPVMVWFHGGGFTILSANSASYNNPTGLTTKGVVLVTVNHRLGPFGYLAHELLTAETAYNGSGNYGQMDLIMALEWIQDNIAAFGGDPDNVTIFGQSGGGGKALSLMASSLAEGLFHKAICESGMGPLDNDLLNGSTLETAHAKGAALFTQLGVTTLAQARAVAWTDIMNAVDALYPPEGLSHDIGTYTPNVDNYYLLHTMSEAIEMQMPNDVPLMAGANDQDHVGDLDLSRGIPEQMPNRVLNSNSTHYVYKWSYVPSGLADLSVGAYHGIELVYVFNYPETYYAHYMLGLTGLTVDYSKTEAQVLDDVGYGAADIALSETVLTLWSNFAKNGDPSTDSFTWPAYTGTIANGGTDQYVEFEPSASDPGYTVTAKTGLETAFPE